jgi:DNA-directed RNA polymerase subunit RPC12/RpoP
MAQYYMFICPNCGTKIAATKEEADQKLYANNRVELYRYKCIKCRMPMLIKGSAMTEIDDPTLAEKDEPRIAPEDEKRLERIALTINHFRSYQYGEPYEGRRVAMSRAFDIVNDDAEVILLGLDVLKDLQELDSSLDAAVNFRIREKRVAEIIQKMKSGIKV